MASLPDAGSLERWVGFVFRPILRITHMGERRVERVQITYSFSAAASTTATTVSSYPLSVSAPRQRTGQAKYIRAWVYNSFGVIARQCRVMLERVWLDDRLVDDERTPLHWADLGDCYALPTGMRQGYRNGHYIDICASDAIDPSFQIISQKHQLRNYHRYQSSGVYRLELTAETENPYHAGHLLMTVRHDVNRWDNLRVISVREGRLFLPWKPPR